MSTLSCTIMMTVLVDSLEHMQRFLTDLLYKTHCIRLSYIYLELVDKKCFIEKETLWVLGFTQIACQLLRVRSKDYIIKYENNFF